MSRTPRQFDESELLALVEGELDIARAARLLAELDADPDMKRRIHGMQADRAALRELGSIRAPRDLVAGAMDAAEREQLIGDDLSEVETISFPRPARAGFQPMRMLALAASLALIAGGSFWAYLVVRSPHGRAASPKVARELAMAEPPHKSLEAEDLGWKRAGDRAAGPGLSSTPIEGDRAESGGGDSDKKKLVALENSTSGAPGSLVADVVGHGTDAAHVPAPSTSGQLAAKTVAGRAESESEPAAAAPTPAPESEAAVLRARLSKNDPEDRRGVDKDSGGAGEKNEYRRKDNAGYKLPAEIDAAQAVALAEAGRLVIRVHSTDPGSSALRVEGLARQSSRQVRWNRLTREQTPVSFGAIAALAGHTDDTVAAGAAIRDVKPGLLAEPITGAGSAPPDEIAGRPAAPQPAPVSRQAGAAPLSLPSIYAVDLIPTESSLRSLLSALRESTHHSATFDALPGPIPARPSVDPAAVFWWTGPASTWRSRVTVPILIEPAAGGEPQP
ncbi:MAG: hypothetical protein JNM07_03375 [Phycisphaerae bacterium]|nr:hypothetical protein [Phycisphaerae bacterium]